MYQSFVVRTLSCVILAFALWQASASAQPYPNKAVRFVVPAVAGGGGSIVARIIGEGLSERWKQPVVVDNRPGAAGMIGSDVVAKSKPDGYTMMLGYASAVTINPSLYSKLPYRPVDDFAPVVLIGSVPLLMVIHPSVPAKTIKDFIAIARARPNQLNYSSSGNGTLTHLAGELFKSLANVGITHVPYRGGLPSFTDVLSGQVAMTFTAPAIAIQHIQSGRLLALGVTSLRRISVFPDLPTIVENGLPGFVVDNWYGVLYPADTSAQIIEKTCDDVNSLLQADTVRRQLLVQGVEPIGSTSREFADVIKRDIAKWEKVVKNIKLQVD